MQMAKRKLMIKPPPSPTAFVSGSANSESSVRILEQAIQVLDKLIRLCNSSSSKNVGTSSSMNVLHTASLKFNHAQCRYLDLQSFHDNLRNLVDEMASLDPLSCDHCRAAAMEIAKVTRNSESFIFSCVSTEDEDGVDSWLAKAVLYAGDDGLSAAHQRQEQQWCVSVLEVVLAQLRVPRLEDPLKHNKKASATTSFHHVPYWMVDRTFEIVEEGLVGETDRGLLQAVRLDRRNLLDKLRKMKHKQDGFFFRGLSVFALRNRRSRVHEMTSYLITKLDVDDEEIESFVERIHQREAWATDGSIQRGGEELFLGTGRFGRVYRSEFLGLPTAVKVTSFYSPDSFWNEVSVLASIRHPRLAQLIFASITDQELRECKLWTELLGKSLDSVLEIMQAQSQTLQLGVAVEIMLQVAEGMAFLHRRGVLHRDLNSFNVLLVPRRSRRKKYVGNRQVLDELVQVKITDFGLPKTKLAGSSSLENMSEVDGSHVHQRRLPLWQAPEVFQETGSVEVAFTKKSDVYSFAMLCYQVLSCRRPFSDVEGLSEGLLFQLVSGERMRPSLPQHCPAYLAALIERCWSHDPERRLSFTQVCLALRSFKGLMSRRQSVGDTLPFTPSDFSHLFSHFGLDFLVEIITMHKKKVCKEGESLFMMMLEKEKKPELWPFPMESFLLWLATSVEQVENADGFGSAAEIIGDLMANWIGSNHDYEQAVFWYYKACTSRSKSVGGSARWKLGMCMESGLGIAKDEKRALGLYKQSAREGCASAHVEVARCYQSGRGAEHANTDRALAHFAKALEMVEKSVVWSSSNSVECVEFLMRLLAKASREEECVWAGKRMQEIVSKSRLGRLVVAGRECCNVRELVGMLGDWKIREVGRKIAKMVLERLAIEDDILQKALLA